MRKLSAFSTAPAILWSPIGRYDFKYCTRCSQRLPIDQFYKNDWHPTGYTNECKACNAKMHRTYRKRPETKAYLAKKDAMRRYGLSGERYDELMATGCAICGDRTRLSIDHDHRCCPGNTSCGRCVRSALCGTCNLGLGAFKDNPELLHKAVQYLQ